MDRGLSYRGVLRRVTLSVRQPSGDVVSKIVIMVVIMLVIILMETMILIILMMVMSTTVTSMSSLTIVMIIMFKQLDDHGVRDVDPNKRSLTLIG